MKLLPTITSRLSGRGIVNIWGYNSWFVVRRRLGFAWYPGWCTRYTGTIDGNTDVWLITQHTPVGDEYYNNDNKNISYTMYSGELRIRLRFLSKIVKRHTRNILILRAGSEHQIAGNKLMNHISHLNCILVSSWQKKSQKQHLNLQVEQKVQLNILNYVQQLKKTYTHTAVNESR